MRHPGVAAEHAPRGGDERRELGEIGPPCKHSRTWQPGLARDLVAQRLLPARPCHEHRSPRVALGARRRGEALGGPAARRARGARVHDRRGARPRRERRVGWIELEAVGVRRHPALAEHPAPARHLVLVGEPRRSIRALAYRVMAKGDQAARAGGQQHPVAPRPAPVEVDRHVGPLEHGVERGERGRVDDLPARVEQSHERSQRGGGGELAAVPRKRLGHRAQRGHGGQEVPEPERAQDQQARALRLG